MTILVPITGAGRMNLPAALRKRLGLSGGGTVFLEETADGVILRTAAQAVLRAQEIARRHTGDKGGSAGFIANRRADSWA
ncbi:MAG: AbrB/MazE/SpoVT family DNA-binding domain-containing protein [Sphingomonadales bacterium]|jgi:AbrB family looped-hinge helix DNA binding protein